MASMDNLRDKIRSRRANTSELQDHNPFSQHFESSVDARTSVAEPGGTGQTDSLISEIFSEPLAQVADATVAHSAEPIIDKKESAFQWPLAGRFRRLEVNRRMLLISLGVAALASFLSMAYLKGIAEPLKGQSKLVKVVSVTQDVPARTPLSEDMLTIKEVPAAYLPEGVVAYEPDMKLLGQVSLTALYKGEVLHKQRISLPSRAIGVSAMTPEGHRAFSIRTDNAYLLQPSTLDRKEYVDVVATIPDPNPVRRGRLITIPILQRGMVLAVGGSFSPEELKEQTTPPSDITLAVPEDRINLMVILKDKGDFSVIPRSPEDTSVQREKYTIEEIENALQGKFEAEKAVAEPTSAPPAQAIKDEEPLPPAAPLVDLSQPAAPAYRAPARQPVRQPVRQAAPPRAAAPKPAAPKAAPPKPAAAPPAAAAPVAPRRAPVVINGGVVTQGGN